MQLTQEQRNQALQRWTPSQIEAMEQRRQSTLKSIEPSLAQEQTQQPQPSNERGFMASLFKRPVERLVMEPARRLTEALVASLPVIPRDIRNKALDLSTQDLNLDIPLFGKFETRGSGGAKQTIGEAMETAAWLYSPSKVGGAIQSGMTRPSLMSGIASGAGVGARAGFVGGGLFGAGDALQNDASAGEAFTQGAMGAGIGTVAGATLGGALPALPLMTRGISDTATNGYKLSENFVSSLLKTSADKGQRLGTSLLEVPKRIVRRTADDLASATDKSNLIKNSPKHIGDALRQGIDNPVVDFLKLGTKQEKIQRAEMLKIARESLTDLSRMDSAKSIPGKAILDGPVKFLIDNANKGTRATNKLLSNLPDKAQNFRNLYDRVLTDFADIGLTIRKGQVLRQRGSRVPDADLPFYQQIAQELIPNKRGQVPLTYKQLDNLRKRWFDSIKADQTFTSGVKGKTGYFNRIRSIFSDELNSATKGKYKEAQKRTAESLQGLTEFVRLIGYKGPLDKLSTKQLKAGETFMRVFGNAADRPTSVLDKMYSVAKQYGYKGQENIMNQLKFADMLESVYGQPSRSIGGQLAKSVSPSADPGQQVASSVREMVKWSPYSGAIRLLRARGLLGKHQSEVMNAFENLILGEAGMPLQTRSLLPLEKSTSKLTGKVKETISNLRDKLGR